MRAGTRRFLGEALGRILVEGDVRVQHLERAELAGGELRGDVDRAEAAGRLLTR